MPVRALIFDVFGTLVDWRTGVARQVSAAFAEKGIAVDASRFATHWRAEYDPGMAPIREGLRGYTPLDELHRENLERVLTAEGHAARFTAEEVTALARAWEALPPWPEVPEALARLRAGYLVAPCSNGSIALMARLARFAGFGWDAILGAEIARDYKPNLAVYRASAAALRLPPGEVMMVAAHNNDLAAAREAGLATAFFPRPEEHGPGQTTDLTPDAPWDIVATDLSDLADRLGA
ncbi:MAG: haloacid dehalogenase type II [Pseudomonadota bacterium]